MPSRIRRHLSFANVTSLAALVFAMAGTGYALTVPRNSVGSAQIRPAAVANSDIASAAVTSSKVRNGALTKADFASGVLSRGPRGASGPAGAAGAPGAPGAFGAITVARNDATVPGNGAIGGAATCPSGTRIIGGGYRTNSSALKVQSSAPARNSGSSEAMTGGAFDSWFVAIENPVINDQTIQLYAVCAQT